MTRVDDATERRRAYAALGLGPRWVVRSGGTLDHWSGHAADCPPGEQGAVATAAVRDAVAAPGGQAPLALLDWDELRTRVSACRACELCQTRTQTVFGVGPQSARWMLIGEAPGAEEDARGEPFVGQAGRLLDSMLAAIGLSRERDVFVANVLKCRPPRNRDPQPDEVRRCEPFLMRQIELLAPDVLLLFGRFAAQSMLGTDASISSLRGRPHTVQVGARQVPAVVTYHPAYLLRTPQDKAKSWRDLLLARRIVAAN